VVGCLGVSHLVEIKDGDKVKSARNLTGKQKDFKAIWKGDYTVVESQQDVIDVVTLWRKNAKKN